MLPRASVTVWAPARGVGMLEANAQPLAAASRGSAASKSGAEPAPVDAARTGLTAPGGTAGSGPGGVAAVVAARPLRSGAGAESAVTAGRERATTRQIASLGAASAIDPPRACRGGRRRRRH